MVYAEDGNNHIDNDGSEQGYGDLFESRLTVEHQTIDIKTPNGTEHNLKNIIQAGDNLIRVMYDSAGAFVQKPHKGVENQQERGTEQKLQIQFLLHQTIRIEIMYVEIDNTQYSQTEYVDFQIQNR